MQQGANFDGLFFQAFSLPTDVPYQRTFEYPWIHFKFNKGDLHSINILNGERYVNHKRKRAELPTWISQHQLWLWNIANDSSMQNVLEYDIDKNPKCTFLYKGREYLVTRKPIQNSNSTVYNEQNFWIGNTYGLCMEIIIDNDKYVFFEPKGPSFLS